MNGNWMISDERSWIPCRVQRACKEFLLQHIAFYLNLTTYETHAILCYLNPFFEPLLLILAVLSECSRPVLAAGSRQSAPKQCFYYFSILLSNWEVSYLFLVFDLLTQPNKTLLCCTTTKSAVHFQPPNKWLAWFIWVISSMWRGSTASPRRKEPLFTTTGQTRWVHYSEGKDGHFNPPLLQK